MALKRERNRIGYTTLVKSIRISRMARLTIPEEYRPGFAVLLNLEKSQVEELVSALKEQQPTSSRISLRANVASNVGHIERSELNSVVDTLVSLFALRDSLNLSTPEFVGAISDAIEQSGTDELTFLELEMRESFEATLTQLLEIDSLEVTAKAIGLAYEQDHIMHGSPRVLTDVRPIFGSDSTEASVRGAMVIHTLRLDYHEGSRVSELFLALDAEELEELIGVLERAKSKAESLKQFLRDSPVHYVDSE